ncbi:MAG: M23 family metallopeptidase [Hyphomicrobiales bacterium]|nr:M23 family metallopeptidase [Hyphomicrobiales bacterium]
MSRRSAQHHHHGGAAHHGGHHYHPPQQPHQKPGTRASYTLAHAGRQVRLGPVAFWVVVGTLVIMAVWSITTATYFAFREDVLTRLIARQADMQFAYEDRIADLRAQVDRISSRQLLDQEQHEQKLDQILRRQSALESRAGALSGLGGDVTGSIRPSVRTEQRPLKPSPIGDKGAYMLQSVEPATTFDPRSNLLTKGAGGVGGVLSRLQASLDRVEQRQTAALSAIEDSYQSKAQRIRTVLTELGVDVGRATAADTTAGLGGPFVPARLPKESIGFERQLHRVALARAHANRLARTLGTVPVRKPVDGDLEPASGFGVRNDPFTGSPAMHTGLDLQGDTGDAVRATADGKVTTAGWSGGYGKVVDVDHGNGISTRYGHLSAVEVQVGQTVKIGQLLGRVGSTGRSTGPHLHYETRVSGKPVDPQRFLRAGQKLQSSI